MKLLDLYCCEGGCSTGYAEAGFEVTGVDIESQPRYPFDFVQADVCGKPWGETKDCEGCFEYRSDAAIEREAVDQGG